MQKKLEILHLLLELTRQGKLIWTQGQYDNFWEARLGEEKLHVEFIYLARTDETGSDRTMARIKFVYLTDYCIGTEGFDLICEMLSLCSPDWAEARKRADEKRAHLIKQLTQLVEA